MCGSPVLVVASASALVLSIKNYNCDTFFQQGEMLLYHGDRPVSHSFPGMWLYKY